MLISPPFLIARTDQTEDAWLNDCMSGGAIGEGGFPVSSYLGWHGGSHLNAPMNGNTSQDVRAIADGTVVYLRQAVTAPANPDLKHPQMYRGQWSDNGLVIIRHDKEIGEGDNGKVSFFSIYMHLSHLDPGVIINNPVYRKAALGRPGRIYGQQNKIHFEIICDDTNLANLVGRATGDLALTANGRTNSVYGDVYFHLPAGAQIFAQQPLSNSAAAMMQPPTPRGQHKPAVVALQPAHTTTEALVIGMRYAGGDGLATELGHAYLTSYALNGVPLGAALSEPQAEYNLFTTASDISNSYPTNARPAPSAVYELLRFGRVIGTDALNPTTVPHWRQVRYPGGQGWVNLNTANVHKFSDADFPQWMGWKLITDDTDADCRCDSQMLKDLLRNTPGEQLTEAELRARAQLPTKADKLKKTICKFPTEWDSGTIDARWGWLKTTPPEALSDTDFEALRAHITVLAFWSAANLRGAPDANNAPGASVPATHWHFDPREFIRHFRKCEWLSKKEWVQTLPMTGKKLRGSTFHEENIGPNVDRTRPAQGIEVRMQRWYRYLNISLRKYGIEKNYRRIHFIANVWEETGYIRLMVEGGGTTASYAPWYGRGLIQLTHQGNYEKYGTYRGFPKTLTTGPYAALGWNPDLLISENDANCIDTAVYWINPAATALGRNLLIDADGGLSIDNSMQTARGTNGNVAAQNLNGLDTRLQVSRYLKYILLENISLTNSESMTFVWRKNSAKTGSKIVNGKEKKFFEIATHTINVDLTPRRPS